MRILVIEHDPLIEMDICMLLEDAFASATIVACDNVESVAAATRAPRFDVVVFHPGAGCDADTCTDILRRVAARGAVLIGETPTPAEFDGIEIRHVPLPFANGDLLEAVRGFCK